MPSVAYDSTHARFIARAIFRGLFLLLGLISGYCHSLYIKRQILRHNGLPPLEAAGWLAGPGMLLQPWRYLHRVPNPGWWLLMVAMPLAAVVADFASSTIRSQDTLAQCPFGTGLVLDLSGNELFHGPPWNGRSTSVAGNAQINSRNNGCSMGIFVKANTAPHFCAADEDMYGTWNCTNVQMDITYPYGTQSEDEVARDLSARNLQYESSSYARTSDSQGLWTHLVVLSSSQADDAKQPFDVRVSVDTALNYTGDQTLQSYQCSMHAPQAEAISSNIPSASTLLDWSKLIQGNLYNGADTPPVTDVEDTLVWLLNSLIMVAGGSNYLLSPPPADHTTQGCITQITYIPPWVIYLALATAASLVLASVVTFYFWCTLRFNPNRAAVEDAPTNLYTWIRHAATESRCRGEGIVKAVSWGALKDYRIVRGNTGGVSLVGPAEEMEPLHRDVGTTFGG
nr:hypothetical protein B0A51_15306 [Rachicladosporium sp. CCFEE 5018]